MIDEGWQWAAIIVSFLSLFATIGLVIYVRFLDGKHINVMISILQQP